MTFHKYSHWDFGFSLRKKFVGRKNVTLDGNLSSPIGGFRSPFGPFSSANLQQQFWKVALFLFALVLLHPVGLVSLHGLPQWLPSCPVRHRNSMSNGRLKVGSNKIPTDRSQMKRTANFVYISRQDFFLHVLFLLPLFSTFFPPAIHKFPRNLPHVGISVMA